MVLKIASTVAMPEFQLVYEEPVYGSPSAWTILILLVLFLLSIIFVFIKNMTTKIETIQRNPERFAFWTNYLKTAAICSILIGLIGMLTGAYESLIITGLSGFIGIDAIAGPIGESLIVLNFGLINAFIALVLRFISQWKAMKYLSPKVTKTKMASQSLKSQ